MKVSLNWIKQFTDVTLPVQELVEKIGAQLGEVEGVEALGARYDKAVVVKVITCEDHPNADRLHVCTIDDGGITPDVNRDENGYVQVVCGAPNVTSGATVVWLPPGATVPDSYEKSPFILEARELRGVVSNGMLASPSELSVGDSHDGLLLLEDDIRPGTLFVETYDLDDYIIDIENKMFTHRPDLFGQLGVAREIAGITGNRFSSPEDYLSEEQGSGATNSQLTLEIRNELPNLVPRFVVQVLENVTIRESPLWMQSYLTRVGIRPVNNVVDITNYCMVLTGQPSHAYDYDKVKAQDPGAKSATLVIRNPRDKERLELLNGKNVDPRPDAIVIASHTKPIGLGGVMGGLDTEIDRSTKNIILEVATFDMYNIRRTSMEHGIFSDAVTRFTKGQSPLQNKRVEAMIRDLLVSIAGATPGSLYDLNPLEGREWLHPPVPITTEFINARLGFNLNLEEMKNLLENVEFEVGTVDQSNQKFTVTAPFWRTDIETREDIVEEIGRLYGFDKLPLELPLRTSRPVRKDVYLETKSLVRTTLSRLGANEVLTYSFVHSELLAKVGQDSVDAFELGNALSPDLQFYRLSVLPSLLDKIHMNVKAGYGKFALFEMGKAHEKQHTDENGLPTEFDNLAFIIASKESRQGAAYYDARAYLEQLLNSLGLEVVFAPLEEHTTPVDAPFDLLRSAEIRVEGNERPVGVVGEFSPKVRRMLKLPEHSAGFEIELSALIANKDRTTSYEPLPRFPKTYQDITFKVSSSIAFAELASVFRDSLLSQKPVHTNASIRPLAIYQKNTSDVHKNVTFRVSLASHDKTMTDAEVTNILQLASRPVLEAFDAKQV